MMLTEKRGYNEARLLGVLNVYSNTKRTIFIFLLP